MNEQVTGRAQFGLDFDRMVREAWAAFIDRPITILGVSALVIVVGFLCHFVYFAVFFWLPFTLCVPFAALQMRREERTDRIFLGWVDRYVRVLAIYFPAAAVFVLLFPLFCPDTKLLDFKKNIHLALFVPIYLELAVASIVTLAALVSIRRNIPATDALFLLFTTRRRTMEVVLLGGMAALFGLSGILVCCVGIFPTTTFAWLCLGVAYHQVFED